MPVQSFYPSFTLAARDADGFIDPLPNETLTIKNAADNSTITTTESDDFGFVAEGLLPSVVPGTEIYFEHATYPNTLPITTTETANAAYYVNPVLTFLVQDLFTEEIEPDTVEVWMKDGDAPYIKIGEAAIGQTVKFPYESFYEKDLDFRLIPIVEGMTQNVKRLEDAPSESLNVSPLSDSLTFEYTQINNFPTLHLAGRTTASTGALEAIQPTNKFTLSGLSLDINEANLTLGNIGGTLGIGKGGTGQTTANGALNAFLPTQTGQSGKFLTTDGSNASWASAGGGITIGTTAITSGTDDRILYQSGGVVQQSASLRYNGSNLIVGVPVTSPHTGTNSERFGLSSSATGFNSTAIGNSASASGFGATALGVASSAGNDSTLAVGGSSSASGTNSTAIGGSAVASGASSFALGYSAQATNPNNIAIGYASNSSGAESAIALGVSSACSGNTAIAIGASAGVSGYRGIGIGESVNVAHTYSIGIGKGATTSADNQLMIGSSGVPVTNVSVYGNGTVTFDVLGSGGQFKFNQHVEIADAKNFIFNSTTGTKIGTGTGQKIGFWNATPVVQQTVTGSRGGNAALADLLTKLATLGLIVDSTS